LKGKESVIFVEGDEQRMMLMGLRPWNIQICQIL
jgi:hypothetical protein